MFHSLPGMWDALTRYVRRPAMPCYDQATIREAYSMDETPMPATTRWEVKMHIGDCHHCQQKLKELWHSNDI